MISEKKIEVTYFDTDMMGIVYHANYIIWFELGRSKFLKDAGFTIDDCLMRKLIFPIVSVKVDYKTPTKYGDEVIVKTYVKNITKVSTTYIQEVYSNNILSVTGEVKLATVDRDTFLPVNLKKRYKDLYDKYSKECAYE
ncbi:MAG: acyl-CoA thioesterase [Bacilli bacterium]